MNNQPRHAVVSRDVLVRELALDRLPAMQNAMRKLRTLPAPSIRTRTDHDGGSISASPLKIPVYGDRGVFVRYVVSATDTCGPGSTSTTSSGDWEIGAANDERRTPAEAWVYSTHDERFTIGDGSWTLGELTRPSTADRTLMDADPQGHDHDRVITDQQVPAAYRIFDEFITAVTTLAAAESLWNQPR